MDAFAVQNSGSIALNRTDVRGFDRTFAVHSFTKRIYYTADHFRSDRDFQDASGQAGVGTGFDQFFIAQQNGTDLVFAQVQGKSCNSTTVGGFDVDHFVITAVAQTVNP